MSRKLAFILVYLAAILPGWAQALGLGEIQMNSFLNQPLDADIEVLSYKSGETDGIKIKLASADAFTRSDIEYTNVLRKLRFKLIKKSNGRQYIKVTTQRSYREPFINFLLEINWANGRIVREYAALVDPPSLVQSSPVQMRSATSHQSSASSNVHTSSQSSTPGEPLFGAPDAGNNNTSKAPSGFIGDTYTTKRNDTAWQIALDTRQGDATVEQAMISILRANPQAFIRNNINRLKAGYELSIPEEETMLSLSHSEALAEVRQQTRVWRNRGRAVAVRKGHLEILPPKADSSDQSQASGSSSGSSADLHREAMLAREAAEAQRQENAELKLRLSALEEQIKNAKRLTTLKSDQLAALEKKLADINAAKGITPVEPPAQQQPAEAMPEAAPAPSAVTKKEEAPAEPKVFVPAVPAEPGTPVNQNIVEGFTPVDISKLPKTGLPAKPFKTGAPATEAVPSAETGLVDDIAAFFDSSPMIAWIAAGAAGLVIIILFLMIMRRRQGDDMFEESILHERGFETSALGDADTVSSSSLLPEESGEEQAESAEAKESIDEETAAVEDTSFLSDMVLSDISEIEGERGESDPLTEADVFLAYGRFGPAETMIKDAIAKEPGRNDLRLKLLEIYYSAKNRDAFASESEALNGDLASSPDSETWEKVIEMGADLCPDHILFSGADIDEDTSAETTVTSPSDEEDTDIMDFDLGEFEDQIDSLETDETDEGADEEQDTGLDLDLDSLSGEDAPIQDPTIEITTELEGIADALGKDADLQSGQDSETTFEIDTETTQSFDSETTREFDAETTQELDTETTREFDAETTQELDTEITRGLDTETTQELDIETTQELDSETTRGLDAEPTTTMEFDAGEVASEQETTQEIEIPDLASELDLGETASSGLPMDDIDLDDDALADIDEVGTKLDLAKAYIDMGDPEGARSILEEVLEEGDEKQKNDADELIKQI
ncbi:MAG TPA: hypothetical protein ENI65_08980 [Gammaproteobacteria bacterium]|nr:hypothetical protein [Gammaproteobacteria bacterium]